MRNKKIISWVLAIVVILSVSYFALSEIEQKRKTDIYKQLELFSDTLAIVESDYVDEQDPKDLIYGALKGMLSSLDPHSNFLDPDEYNELKVDTKGEFGGLGIEITIKDGLLTIISPIEDTPAWRAGVKAGDRIVKIDNELTRDITLTDAVKKLRGKPGTEAALTILRESSGKILEFKIVRDIIKIRDIKNAKILEDKIGYLRLVEFRESTPASLKKALSDLKKSGMDSFILDLRNNPGGLLDIAVSVTEEFVPQGKIIVTTKGRKDKQNFEFKSQSVNPDTKTPMVVMINEGSASGSEIVAGALQDYKRAIILGAKSFGKGSVQTVIPLSDGSAIRLTTSKYYTPNGRSIHGTGIEPDIKVEYISIGKEENEEEGLAKKEVIEKKNEEVFKKIEEKKEIIPEKKELSKEEPKSEFDYTKDNQLMRAIDLLKGIKVYNQFSSVSDTAK